MLRGKTPMMMNQNSNRNNNNNKLFVYTYYSVDIVRQKNRLNKSILRLSSVSYPVNKLVYLIGCGGMII